MVVSDYVQAQRWSHARAQCHSSFSVLGPTFSLVQTWRQVIVRPRARAHTHTRPTLGSLPCSGLGRQRLPAWHLGHFPLALSRCEHSSAPQAGLWVQNNGNSQFLGLSVVALATREQPSQRTRNTDILEPPAWSSRRRNRSRPPTRDHPTLHDLDP